MASSSMSMFSTSCPPSPLPTDEQFNLYHSIDRQLYKILIFNLGRDMAESMHVMAFWLWMEQQIIGGMTLVKKMLCLPHSLINDLADEAALCLKCVENEEVSHQELSLIPIFVGKNITLNSLYQQRVKVVRGITLMINQVCIRIFCDINKSFLKDVNKSSISFGGLNFHQAPTGEVTIKQVVKPKTLDVDDELDKIFGGKLNLKEYINVSPDDRTIFLTFSKGYPITEREIREFFTRY